MVAPVVFRVEKHRGRAQEFTVWYGIEVFAFGSTLIEALERALEQLR